MLKAMSIFDECRHRHPSFGEETIDGWIPVSLPFIRHSDQSSGSDKLMESHAFLFLLIMRYLNILVYD